MGIIAEHPVEYGSIHLGRGFIVVDRGDLVEVTQCPSTLAIAHQRMKTCHKDLAIGE